MSQQILSENEKVEIRAYGAGEVTIANLSKKEIDILVGAISSGSKWIRVEEGRLKASSVFEPLPNPIKDEKMFPFWRAPSLEEKEMLGQLKLIEIEKLDDHASPSIQIGSLCGYYYSPEKYKTEGEKLKSYGFTMMRSARGEDGKFWEIWYLPGLWCAEGRLKEAVENSTAKTDKKKLAAAVSFLSSNVSFGTLDLCVQKLAMIME